MQIINKFDFEQPSSIKLFFFILIVLIIAIGIRIYYLDYFLVNGILDSNWYIHAGLNYSIGNLFTFTVTNKGPLLTLFLGVSIRLLGPTYLATKVVSLISGSLLPISVFFLGSELFGKKVGLIAALIVAINPLLILYHGLVFREPLYSLFWTCFIFFLVRGFRGSKLYSILGGVFFALSAMTIEIGLFAAIGVILYFSYERFFKEKEFRNITYEYIGFFFVGALLTLSPFLVRNYIVYGEIFVQWVEFLDFLFIIHPYAPQILLWSYLGLMILITIIIFISKFFNFNIRFRRNSFFSFLYSSSNKHSFINQKRKKILFILLFIFSIFIIGLYEIINGPGIITRIVLGAFKLLETLVLPESMGFLLFFSILLLLYTAKRSAKFTLIALVFLFSIIGIAWGIVSHYGYWLNLDLNEIFTYIPYDPLDNAYRYVSSYIQFLTIFAVYGGFLLAAKLSNALSKIKSLKISSNSLRTIIILLLTISIIIQSFYGLSFLVTKAQKDSNSLTESYNPVVQWLNSQGTPRIYSFNNNLKNLYGPENLIVLKGESLIEIARRASHENIEFIISDIFGTYSQAQLALFLGGYNDNPSMINSDRFQLTKSYRSWPSVQIFKISLVDPNQMALVVEHNNYGGREWFSLLSRDYLVDLINDDEDLTVYFSGDYKLIVLGELRRALTISELEILKQKVSDGAVLVICGLSPAYLDLDNNSDWIGASTFVEAPKDAKWKIRFTESAINIENELEIDENYDFYSNSNWSSPTGIMGIEEDVLVLANRVEDEAVAIYAKPYFDGTVIFNGIRLNFAKFSEDYKIITEFLEVLRQKAISKELFSYN